MRFVFDQSKSDSNVRKHGIDFVTAQQLWDDPNRVELSTRYPGEERWLLFARIDGRLWTAVFTRRDSLIRIISVRRARREEESEYEKNFGR